MLDALHLSRATFSKIQQNLCWAFAYNLVGIPLAAGALLPTANIALTPSIAGMLYKGHADAALQWFVWMRCFDRNHCCTDAGALMGVSSLAVMANSLLLQRTLPPAASAVVEEEPIPETGPAAV